MDKEITKSSNLIYDGKIIKVKVDDIELENKRCLAKREVVLHRGAVCGLVRTDDNKIIFVKQYRYPLGMGLLELPAGKLEEGEDPDKAIRRELQEEVGIIPRYIIKMGHIYSTPGFSNEKLYLYYVESYDKTETNFDDDEDLDIYEYSFEEVDKLIENNELTDAKSICLYHKVKEFMNKEIDWDEVDRESEEYLKKCALLDKQIREERRKDIDLKEVSERVNKYIEEYNLPSVDIEDLKGLK